VCSENPLDLSQENPQQVVIASQHRHIRLPIWLCGNNLTIPASLFGLGVLKGMALPVFDQFASQRQSGLALLGEYCLAEEAR
jgi:hypothetical protein